MKFISKMLVENLLLKMVLQRSQVLISKAFMIALV